MTGRVQGLRRAASADADLVAAVRGDDDAAFEALYGRYARRIAAYVAGMVGDPARAEEVTQEVSSRPLRRMRATQRPIAVKPCFYEIARNACIDAFRHRPALTSTAPATPPRSTAAGSGTLASVTRTVSGLTGGGG